MRAAKVTFTSQTTPNIQPVFVEATETLNEYLRGLQGRVSLADGHGMLFMLPEPRLVYFWMSQVYFPLDMIFIDADGKIAHVERNAAPLSLAARTSGTPTQAVLEVPGGWADRNGAVEGTLCVIEDVS